MSATAQVDRGTSVRVRTVFKVAGVVTDPTTIVLEVRDAAGALTTYTYAATELTKESTGIYYRDVLVSSEGIWSFRMTGTGSVPASAWATIECRRDPF